MKKRVIPCAVLLSVLLPLSGCVVPYGGGIASAPEYEDIVTDVAAAPFDSDSGVVFKDIDGGYGEFEDSGLQKRFIPLYNEIVSGEYAEPTVKGSEVYGFTAADRDGTPHRVSLMRSPYEAYLTIDGRCYPENAEMNKLAREIISSSDPERIPGRMFDCRYECDEPVSKEDFIKAAQGCVFMWLDTLKDESGAYKITGYSPDEYTDGKFIAAGTVGGATEFAVEVMFDVSGVERGSVFKTSDGSYNKFYHYYDGSCVFVRCRWENGACRIVDYDGAFSTGEKLKSGLNGINNSENGYATFFDFFNDTEKYSEYKSGYPGNKDGSIVVSHNPFMLSDGNIFYVDIRADSASDIMSAENGIVTSKFDRAFYDINGVNGYSSPVDYNDAEQSAVTFSYSRDFDLLFDDYNRDGSPDYTIRLGTGAGGSYYETICIDNNGRPRPNGGIVYCPGRFEESVRLQMTEDGVVNRNENGEPDTVLDSFRMYSQRYYLPPQLKGYKLGDRSVICSFWNNTDQPVSAGGKYRVERLDGGEWTDAGVSGSVPERTVEPYYYADIEFDISGLSGGSSGEYRIVLENNRVCGGFYIDDSAPAECTVTPECDTLPAGRKELTFELAVNGASSVRPTSASLYRDGEEVTEVDVSGLGSIDPSGAALLTAAADGESFGEGVYTLKVRCGAYEFTSGAVELVNMPDERRFFFGGSADAQLNDGKLSVTVTNNISTGENARISDVSVEVERNGVWVRAGYMYNGDDNGLLQPLTAKPEEPLKLNFEKLSHDRFGDKLNTHELRGVYNDLKDSLDKMLSDGSISKADYVRFKSMSFEEFLRSYPRNTAVSSGDRCRVVLAGSFGTEYAYYDEP